ncbi:MAG: DPP IV N-terminal domain-containing protein [Flavobacteriales bacterium]|nr:DPP IV N-terminal domain-containing protein [Bacteroidota bacterium]MCB9239761.1 DPP IV N-terminal domain-containing protein [Flavobacteriales bacterium]
MFKRILTPSLLLLLPILAGAQDSKMLTMEDAILGYHLYPRGMNQLQWVDNSHYSYVMNADGTNAILVNDLEQKKNGLSRSITVSDLNEALSKAKLDSIKGLPPHSWAGMNDLRFEHAGFLLSYVVGDKTVSKVTEMDRKNWQHAESSKDSKKTSYVKDNNLFIHRAMDQNDLQLTKDGGSGIVYGQSVHRDEFGITGGMFWAPNSEKLAFYRMDESMVTDYPIYDLGQRPAGTRNIKYPCAGDKSHHVTIGVYDLNSGKTVYLKTGEPAEQFLTNVAWGPDSRYIYVAVVNRAQNHMWLRKYDAKDGRFIKTLFEETNSRYVEPEHPVSFVPNSKVNFVWWSERDGYNHLYLYDTSGRMLKQLTKGSWVVTDFLGWSPKQDMIYIQSTKESPLSRDLYCVNVKNNKTLRLTTGEGCHYLSGNSANTAFIDNFTSTITPRDVRIIDEKGSVLETLKESENPLKDYKLGEMTIGSIPNGTGPDLYYRLFKPVDFDPNKKYPVIVYLYGGPHLQLITNSWLGGANHWYHYLAQQGFIVFSIDNRGSSNRGFDFESSVHRQLGTLEMQDQLTGLSWLKKNNWVDSTRMGIHGWSFGGFMTTSMMTRNPGVFKVGVAGGPVIDWTYYEVMYTERYMDTPEENPVGFKNNNLLNYVGDLEGNLLMIHGAEDDVVLWQHSLMFLQKAIELDKTGLDYFVYPHHPHNVRGKDRLHLYQKVTEYLVDHLKE